ncbi:hypothetical protein EVAR_99094_1 [Eumeta japonica]|uniref:Major facilitator superfamily (MFS) profile domain-containing protein n=1 Tax=Eumeta variegata TaxID=151549 RepID=A0A4C2AAM6_EUMVA|nr:hypothetical protein EVAR_99094_1 [Eumeta japonica]
MKIKDKESGYFSKFKNLSAFSSQYLYNEDDPINPGYEITDPECLCYYVLTMAISVNHDNRSKLSSRDGSTRPSRLNSKPSLSNLTENRSRKSSTLYLNESKKNSAVNLGALAQERETYKPKRKASITLKTLIPESEVEDCPTLKAPQDLKAEEKAVVENLDPVKAKSIADKAQKDLVGSKSLRSYKFDEEYGDKYQKDNHSNISMKNRDDLDDRKYIKDNHSNQSSRTRHRRKSNNFNYESEVLKQASLKLEEYLREREENNESEKYTLIQNNQFEEGVVESKKEEEEEDEEDDLTFWEKVTIFFDLDLLKDFTYINLMLGITLANFNELNFSILTPFILKDYGFTIQESAHFMSLLAGIDICVRFCVPLFAGRIGWDNNSFFLLGVTMAMGRVVLATLSELLRGFVAVMIGFGKGFRTVFMALVIPTHVPLHKLPGATGIQL